MLEIEFTNGKVYSASDVPEQAYKELMASASAGSYFQRVLKPAYSFTQE